MFDRLFFNSCTPLEKGVETPLLALGQNEKEVGCPEKDGGNAIWKKIKILGREMTFLNKLKMLDIFGQKNDIS